MLQPKDINEERDLALARSLMEVTEAVEFLLEELPEPKETVKFKKLHQLKAQLRNIRMDRLQIYFFGD